MVASRDVNRERSIREWFSKKLITGKIRGQVMQGQAQTEGLNNRLIDQLVDAYLVRREKRRGATWFELAHDRLIQPVTESNEQWEKEHLEDFQRRATVWSEHGHPDGLLLLAEDLTKAETTRAKLESEAARSGSSSPLRPIERRFLEESWQKQIDVDRGIKQAALRRFAIISTVVGALAVVGASITTLQYIELTRARKAQAAAEKDTLLAQRDAKNARETRSRVFLDLLSNVFPIQEAIIPGMIPGEVVGTPEWKTVVGEPVHYAIARLVGSESNGRVLVCGHDTILAYRATDGSNKFLEVVLTWLRGDKPAVVLVSTGHKEAYFHFYTQDGDPWLKLRDMLQKWQYTPERIDDLSDRARLKSAGILIVPNS